MMGQIAQKMTMLKRWSKMLTGKTAVAVEQSMGRAYNVGQLSGYYNDLTGKVTGSTLLDEGGVPVSVIAGGARVHFPIAIFQYGLGCYDLSILRSDEVERFLDALRVCSDWAIGAQRDDGSWDAFGPIGSAKYSVSSMAQGEGCSMLLRAHAAFGDECYRVAALKAAEFMLIDMDNGGVSSHDGGELFLEEYPQRPRRSVMNGWCLAFSVSMTHRWTTRASPGHSSALRRRWLAIWMTTTPASGLITTWKSVSPLPPTIIYI